MYAWISISKLGAKFRRGACSCSLLLHFVKGLRCFVAGRVVDEAFRESELRLVLLISMVLRQTEGVHGLPCPCCPVVEVDGLSGQNLFAVLDCGNDFFFLI